MNDRIERCPTCGRYDTNRTVVPFVHLDDCQADQQSRGDCTRFDTHGLWWSVPMELNVHEIVAQVDLALAAGRLARIDPTVKWAGV